MTVSGFTNHSVIYGMRLIGTLRSSRYAHIALPVLCNVLAILRRKQHRFKYSKGFFGATCVGNMIYDRCLFDYNRDQMINGPYHNEQSVSDLWFRYYHPAAGDIIVDVGAHIGTDTVVFAQSVSPTGKVVAIESQPRSVELLRHNLAENDCANVQIYSCAVSDFTGTSLVSGDSTGVGAVIGNGDTVVTLDRLDNILSDLDHISFMKMNIEGYERPALLGGANVLLRCKYVAIACHDFLSIDGDNPFCETLEFVKSMLTLNGFEVYQQYDENRPWVSCHLHAVNLRFHPSD